MEIIIEPSVLFDETEKIMYNGNNNKIREVRYAHSRIRRKLS